MAGCVVAVIKYKQMSDSGEQTVQKIPTNLLAIYSQHRYKSYCGFRSLQIMMGILVNGSNLPLYPKIYFLLFHFLSISPLLCPHYWSRQRFSPWTFTRICGCKQLDVLTRIQSSTIALFHSPICFHVCVLTVRLLRAKRRELASGAGPTVPLNFKEP